MRKVNIYEIAIYDKEGNCLSKDYKPLLDHHQAEIKAKSDCDWLGGERWEVRKIK